MNIIGELLYAYRKEYGLTQNELVEALSAFSTDLQKLNTVTLSRWETGTTSPGPGKKKALLTFISTCKDLTLSPILYPMIQERYKKLSDATMSALPGANAFLLGNLPAFDDTHDCIHDLHDRTWQDAFLGHIIDVEKSAHSPGYCRLSRERMEQYLQKPSTFAIVCARRNQYLGHFVMLKIRPKTAIDIAHGQRSKYDIRPEELCSKEEMGSYLMQAIYASNPKYAMLMRTDAYLFLLDNMRTIKDFLIFSTRTDGETMRKSYGIAQVATGEDEHYGFKWFGLLSPIEDILFSDTVIKLIF